MENYKIEQSEDFYEGKYSEYAEYYNYLGICCTKDVNILCGIWGSDFEGEKFELKNFAGSEYPIIVSFNKVANKIIYDFDKAYYYQYGFIECNIAAIVKSTDEIYELIKDYPFWLEGNEKKAATNELFSIVNDKVFNDCPVVEEIPCCGAIMVDLLMTYDSCKIDRILVRRNTDNEIKLELKFTLCIPGEESSKKFEDIVWFRKIARELKSLIFYENKTKPKTEKLRTWVLQHLKINSELDGISKVRPKDIFKGTAEVSEETAQQILIDLARVFGLEDYEIPDVSVTWEECTFKEKIEKVNGIHDLNFIDDELSFLVFAANRYGLGEEESLALLTTLDDLVSSGSLDYAQETDTDPVEESDSATMVNAFSKETSVPQQW